MVGADRGSDHRAGAEEEHLNTDIVTSFVTVARTEGYTAASRELNLNQSTVYQHVRQLERLLEASLVRQVGKRVVLTEEGRLVLPHALGLMEQVRGLSHATLDDEGDLRPAVLDIIVGTTFGQSVLPSALVPFHRRFPNIHIQMAVVHDTSRIDDAVLKFGYDGGFHSSPSCRVGLLKEPVLRDELIVVASAEHILMRSRESVSAESLAAGGVVSYRSGFDLRALVERWAYSAGVMIPVIMELDSQVAMVSAAMAGAGPAIVSGRVAAPFLESSRLAMRQLEPPIYRDWFHVHRDGGAVPKAMGQLVSEITKLGMSDDTHQPAG